MNDHNPNPTNPTDRSGLVSRVRVDPAAVKAEHEEHVDNGYGYCGDPDAGFPPDAGPCLPYLLAVEVERLAEKYRTMVSADEALAELKVTALTAERDQASAAFSRNSNYLSVVRIERDAANARADAAEAKVQAVEALAERADRSAGLNFSVSTAALRAALAADLEAQS